MPTAPDETPRGDAVADARPGYVRYAPLAAVAVVMAIAIAMGWHRALSLDTLVRHHAELEAYVAAHRVAAVAGFVAIYVAAVALSLPGAVFLTVAGGLLFGWWVGATAAAFGATIGATLIFLAARSAFGEALVRRAGARAARIAEGFRADAFSYLLFLRLVPVFPFWLVNLVPAIAGVKLSTFVAATAIGILPGAFVFALVGRGLESVIVAQQAAYERCRGAGRADCRLDFDLSAALTPEIVAGLVGLGLLALVPVAVKRWRGPQAVPPT